MNQEISKSAFAPGTHLQVETETRTYDLVLLNAGQVLISGHPRHCPEPVRAQLLTGIGADNPGRISEGVSLRYYHPGHGIIRTSTVRRVTEVN